MRPFEALAEELTIWRAMGRTAHFWWRDDDASCGSRQLDALLALLRTECLFLAVVPGRIKPDLVSTIKLDKYICVMQHGWNHTNHALPNFTSNEFPSRRTRDEVERELRTGQSILAEKFPTISVPIFVPPWHQCALWILEGAAQLGFRGVSLDSLAFPLLTRGYANEINTEIDLCDWSRNGAFIGTARLEASLVRALKIRRKWSQQSFPIGILSHHEYMTDSDFSTLGAFLQLLRAHGVNWADARTLFPT